MRLLYRVVLSLIVGLGASVGRSVTLLGYLAGSFVFFLCISIFQIYDMLQAWRHNKVKEVIV